MDGFTVQFSHDTNTEEPIKFLASDGTSLVEDSNFCYFEPNRTLAKQLVGNWQVQFPDYTVTLVPVSKSIQVITSVVAKV